MEVIDVTDKDVADGKVLNLLEHGMMKISRSTSMELTPGQMQEQN